MLSKVQISFPFGDIPVIVAIVTNAIATQPTSSDPS